MTFLSRTSDLLLSIATALADDREAVTVTVRTNLNPITIEIRVASGDLGKIIGKQGRTARSIRTIISASAQQAGHPPIAIDIDVHRS